MIFSLIGLAAIFGVRETLAEVPRCNEDVTLGCRFLSELANIEAQLISDSVEEVTVAEFALLLKATHSCDEGDSVEDCDFWKNWANDMFDHTDVNGDGVIDMSEKLVVSEAFEHELHIDNEITEEENMSALPQGDVSRADFVDAFKAQMLAEAFLAADYNGDFVISQQEMEAIAVNGVNTLSASAAETTGSGWMDLLTLNKEALPALAALPTSHLYSVLFPAIERNGAVVLGLDSHRRRLFWFFVCIWLCTAAVVAVAEVATSVDADDCEFAEHTRLGQLERLEGRCH